MQQCDATLLPEFLATLLHETFSVTLRATLLRVTVDIVVVTMVPDILCTFGLECWCNN
jgi:hypothetical protein